ncbi:ABC transporter permease [Streptomyces sp. NBC_01622]|uniref:ABC transporter permease n=1 Tax=Streptomyces sp. NBC_01622 TaxID=2975903 RepID=UPI00386ACC13|nr:ABC transporter permease [Streptomyces sp. NBC_01622]
MLTLIARRLALSVPLLVMVTAVTFVLESLVPGDTARALIGASGSTEAYNKLRDQLGLDKPLWSQYGHYLDNLVHGSLGTSVFTGQPVSATLNQRLPVTLSLVLLATVFAAVVGILLGVVSAVRGGVLGRFVEALSLVGLALPGFWVALVLVEAFAVALRAFPATGYVSPTQSFGTWLWALCLPVTALGLVGIASIAKQTRDSMKDALASNYIRTLRANGIPRRSIIWKHALRNGAIPVVTVIGLAFVSALSASVFIEAVFVLPGLGSIAVNATNQHDIPIIEGAVLYFTVLVVIVNLVLDVLYGLLNPKVRHQ